MPVHTPVETWDVHEFTYLSPAVVSKTMSEEKKSRLRAYWDLADVYWERCDPYQSHGEGAGSFENFTGRVTALEQRVHASRQRFIAIFCHGFVIQTILWANQLAPSDKNAGKMRDFYAFLLNRSK